MKRNHLLSIMKKNRNFSREQTRHDIKVHVNDVYKREIKKETLKIKPQQSSEKRMSDSDTGHDNNIRSLKVLHVISTYHDPQSIDTYYIIHYKDISDSIGYVIHISRIRTLDKASRKVLN